MAKKTCIREIKLVCKTCGKTFYKCSTYPIYEGKVAEWEEQMREQYDECKSCWAETKKKEREAQPPTCEIYAHDFMIFIGAHDKDELKSKDFMEEVKPKKFAIGFAWSGNTYPVKDQIRETGARWDAYEYRWFMKAYLTPSQLLETIEKIKNTVDGVFIPEDTKKILALCKKIVDFK